MSTLALKELVAGRFEVTGFLGAGGLAEVYGVRDKETGRALAIKILHAHLADDEKLCERFRRELLVTRSLDHAGIVRAYELYRHGARPLLSMELLKGETLAARLERGALPLEEARRIAVEIALALQAAHRAGLVHRDLKPQNVMLTYQGQVKLLDFGLARAAGWARLTAQSTVMGTPGYLAPELLEGGGCDARADLYSLGATFFEMLTGARAFPSLDAFETLQRKSQAPPSPRALAPQIPEQDDALVRRALEPDPERRFLDAEQIIRALSGAAPAPALPAPPALTGGEVDVIVYQETLAKRAGLERVLERLDARVSPRWRRRLLLAGQAVLVSRASQRSAAQVVAICEQEGVECALEPSRSRSPAREALARHAAPLGLSSGVTAGGLTGWLAATAFGSAAGTIGAAGVAGLMPFVLGLGGIVGVAGAAVAWTLAGLGEAPPIRELPAGDAPLLRVMAGILRRSQRIQEVIAAAPAAQRGLATELQAGTERLLLTAQELVRSAERIPDPLGSPDPDAVTLPPGALAARDAGVTRLLEIAAALDEVLAVLRAGKLDDGPAKFALAQLREEATWALGALDQLDVPSLSAAVVPASGPVAEPQQQR